MPHHLDGCFPAKGDLIFYDVPYEEVHTWRNEQSRDVDFKPFINTRFKIEKGKNRLCIVVGESWTYGGGIRNMDVVEEPDSIAKAVHTTLGLSLIHI